MKEIVADSLSGNVKVGDWKISPTYGILASPESKSLVLEPRLAKLIYLLSENADAIVTRDYLIKNIWTETIVNDESLTRAIADLRKVLRENFIHGIGIETIPKRGYKLTLSTTGRVRPIPLKIGRPKRYVLYGATALFLTFLWYIGFLKIVVM
ncbi:MAG: winged helix-turn-helix domain-containing protein [Ekhidna sp.]